MGVLQSKISTPHSFHAIHFGIPHTSACSQFDHVCDPLVGPTTGSVDAALPRLHLQVNVTNDQRQYPSSIKFYGGMTVWVDEWGRVSLADCHIPAIDNNLRYFKCVDEKEW